MTARWEEQDGLTDHFGERGLEMAQEGSSQTG